MVDNPGNNADRFVTFKPLYTLQPVKATRDKQLKLWVDLIIRYCREHNVIQSLAPKSADTGNSF